MFKRRKRKGGDAIDSERLTLFRLEAGERPIETAVAWMPLGFANGMGMDHGIVYPSPPPDGMLGMTLDQWLDPADSEGRAAVFGVSIAMAHVLVLITDRRLLWLPIDAEARTRSSAYPTFRTKHLHGRSIQIANVDLAESVGVPRPIEVAGGFTTGSYVRLQFVPEVGFAGDSLPTWNPQQLPNWTAEGDEVQIWISTGMEFIADLLAIALSAAGVPIKPPEWVEAARGDRPNWTPLFERIETP